MKQAGNIVLGFTTIGFVIGLLMGIFAFTDEGRSGSYVALYLILCPPSVAAMHDQSLPWAIITWALICVTNAALYMFGGLVIQWMVARIQN